MPTTNIPVLVRTTRNVGPFWHIRIRRMVTGCDYVSFSSTHDETKATDNALKDACRRTAYSTPAGFRVVDVVPVTVIEHMERADHDMPHTDIIESAAGTAIHPDDLRGVDPVTNRPDMLASVPVEYIEGEVIFTAPYYDDIDWLLFIGLDTGFHAMICRPAAPYSATTAWMYLTSSRLLCGSTFEGN